MIMGPSNETLNKQHQYCSVIPNSWCKYQVDQINGTSFYNQQNCLPPAFRGESDYIFKRLCRLILAGLSKRADTKSERKFKQYGLGSMSKACALRY